MAAGRLLRSDGCFVALFHHRFIIPFRMTEQEAEDGAGFLPACGAHASDFHMMTKMRLFSCLNRKASGRLHCDEQRKSFLI